MKRGFIALGFAFLLLASMASATVHTGGAADITTQEDDVTVVIDPTKPNVLRGEWIYWPMTVSNTGEADKTVTLGVQGVQEWATYRIDPQRTLTVEAGEQEQAYLYLAVDEDAPLGMTTFDITATTADSATRTPARLAVISETDRPSHWLVWTIVAIVLLALAILYYALTRREEGGGEDEVLSFY